MLQSARSWGVIHRTSPNSPFCSFGHTGFSTHPPEDCFSALPSCLAPSCHLAITNPQVSESSRDSEKTLKRRGPQRTIPQGSLWNRQWSRKERSCQGREEADSLINRTKSVLEIVLRCALSRGGGSENRNRICTSLKCHLFHWNGFLRLISSKGPFPHRVGR